jgi:hypothetical protein
MSSQVLARETIFFDEFAQLEGELALDGLR